MNELTNNSSSRKELLKHMILQLHKGEAPNEVRKRLVELLKNIPYNEVVQVEQELINEGLPEEKKFLNSVIFIPRSWKGILTNQTLSQYQPDILLILLSRKTMNF